MNKSLILNDDALNNLFNNHPSIKGGDGNTTVGNVDAIDRLLQELSAPPPPPTKFKIPDIFEQQNPPQNAVPESATSTARLSEIFAGAKSGNVATESATSPDDLEIMNAMPVGESQIVYHVIFDSDFGMRNRLHERNAPIFGKMRFQKNDKVPIMFDLQESKNVALRLIDQAVKMGTIGNKQYPVFGAIVLGLRLNNVSVSNGTVDSGSGARDYNSLLNSNSDLVVYNVNGNKRGVLSNNALAKTEVVNAVYVKKLDTQANIGFYLHNINPNLSSDDIKLLKQLYDANGEQVIYNATQLGGNNTDDYKAYVRAKRSYLKLKQMNGQTGGSNSKHNDDDDKIMYLAERSRYFQLKEIAKQKRLI